MLGEAVGLEDKVTAIWGKEKSAVQSKVKFDWIREEG